ncbi:hypothetical protein PUMCH_004297 [Australozyma saopauloensis]|uniref:Opaque-phase-specific protein OP4 n=1 Tax=Australozyma saopauloensis TaxID=291208 RepID=A0AAX4HEK6_9ASCO|nr:hypothetical protein PUMCH_004297 [[Candida] saopauloensis]
MKVSTLSASLMLAMMANVNALPASISDTKSTALTPAQEEQINALIVQLDSHTAKRALIIDSAELQKRDYAIVTQILAAIDSTNLAPMIIQGLVDNKNLQPIVTQAAILIIKSGLISLDTLFTALTQSGLATTVIQDILDDCTFYQDIFKLALQEISGLVDKIKAKLSGQNVNLKRSENETDLALYVEPVKRYDPNGVVNQLLESLAQSGLASSVVRALIVDPQFLQYGASLLKQLFDQNLINFSGLLSAIKNSGLVTSLFKEFFNVSTLKTVIFNSLAAAFNQCGGLTISGSPTGLVTQTSTTTVLPSFTATGTTIPTGTCKRRRKRRSYNY